jgi:hypothetical protein
MKGPAQRKLGALIAVHLVVSLSVRRSNIGASQCHTAPYQPDGTARISSIHHDDPATWLGSIDMIQDNTLIVSVFVPPGRNLLYIQL